MSEQIPLQEPIVLSTFNEYFPTGEIIEISVR